MTVSRRLKSRAACRERCWRCCSGLTRVLALCLAYLLWLTGGIFGLHWCCYCGSRCLQHLCRYVHRQAARLRYWHARRWQASVGAAAEEEPLEGVEDKNASGDTQREKGKEAKQRSLLQPGAYVAGLGVVDSAAAARVAVAHTLATLGSGRSVCLSVFLSPCLSVSVSVSLARLWQVPYGRMGRGGGQ